MLVGDIMSTHVETCSPESSLKEVAISMKEFDCGALPVVESGPDGQDRLVGIITDRDIVCRCVALGKDAGATRVAECMTAAVATISPTALIEECCRLLEKKQIRRVPVLDEQGRCQGIIAQADIARSANSNDIVLLLRRVSEPTPQPL